MHVRSPALVALVAAFAITACGGEEPFDATRRTEPRGTLGEEIFGLFHRDFVREDERKAEGFELERDGFVGAIDHLFPPDELRYTQDFLIKLLPLQDDGTIPGATRKLAAVLTRMAEDDDVMRSAAVLMQRAGYVDLDHEAALVRRIAAYPEFRPLAKALLSLALEHDGFDADGAVDPAESDAMTVMIRHLATRMRDLEISEDAERGIVLAADLMLREDTRLAENAPDALDTPEIVLRDPRGFAKLASTQVAAPFVDVAPADGLPDVDASGRFVSASGTPLDVPPFGTTSGAAGQRDSKKRLVSTAGQPVFDYVRLDQTILAGMLRDGRQLVEEGIPMKAVRTLDTVLGARLADGTYAPDNGILDLVHAASAAGDLDQLPEVFYLLRVLLEDHEATSTWAILELESQLDIADRYTVNLEPGNVFFDDLMSTVRKILREPRLMEDLLVALRDPAVAGLPAAMTRLMKHKKALITEADVAAGRVFTTPVDRGQLDVPGNQSLQQRLFHLIYDTKGARYEPSLIGIPLGFIFSIEDLAEFYLLSVIGEAEIPSLVSTLTGLSERPTPEELAAFINTDQTFGNAQGHEGFDVKDNDGDTLFAASASGMLASLRPVIQVFYDHGQMRLLFELFEVLHLHWATSASDYQSASGNAPRYSKRSGIARYEPLLIDQFENARVLDATRKLLDETKDLRTQRGRLAHDLLLILARKLVDKDTNLRARDGRREVSFDGERITPLSPFDLVRYARARLKAAVRRSAQSQAEWDDLVDAVHRTFLKTERTGPESGRLQNPRALPVASAVLSFLEERAQRHKDAGDLTTWITVDVPQTVEDAITSPELPAMFDMLYAIDADTALNDAIVGLRDELLDEQRGFPDLLVTAGDLMQTMKDASNLVPFARFLGRELDPDAQLLFTLASMAEDTLAVDEDEHFLEVARRAIEDAPSGRLYATGLGRAIRQVNRVNPLDEGTPDATDLVRITSKVARWLQDQEHGLEKFYDMVKKRKREDLE
ncbi:hypothetical protein L6R52_19445 [Myxococcota bacterium]|nr:hypothetical protein [Myxococcota bacterium]